MVAADNRLREVVIDEDLGVLRLLMDRRDELAAARTQALNRAPSVRQGRAGGATDEEVHRQYHAPLAGIRPRDALARYAGGCLLRS